MRACTLLLAAVVCLALAARATADACPAKVCKCPTTGLPPCVDIHSAKLQENVVCNKTDTSVYCTEHKGYVRNDHPDEPEGYYDVDPYGKGGYRAASVNYGGYQDCDGDEYPCHDDYPKPPPPTPSYNWTIYNYSCTYQLLGEYHRCREARFGCDLDTYCNGTSPLCPKTKVKPCGHVCRHAHKGNPCDVPEECDGKSKKCPSPKYAPDGTACSYEPYGRYTAVDDKDGKYGKYSEKDAKSKGWHKCHKCYSGVCVTWEAKAKGHKGYAEESYCY